MPAPGLCCVTSASGVVILVEQVTKTMTALELDGDPVGSCAVEPRTVYVRLVSTRVPWAGRAEDKTDDGIWAVTSSPALVSGASASAGRWRASPSTSPGNRAHVPLRATR